MTDTRVHAFSDDVLADHDAVAVADLIRRGEISAREAADAAIRRAEKVDPVLNAVVYADYDRARPSTVDGLLAGVPTYVKDNTDVHGMPTNHGTAAYVGKPAAKDGPYAAQYISSGMTVLGKSRLPEFGFNASTEFADAEPTHNPWHTEHSPGASSGGAAALVAAGVVPIAHANDGGGSIRIPAACCGLIGLKPSRGRHVDGDQARSMPINIVSEGVVSRSVRDSATFIAAMERTWRNPSLPPVGLVEGPANRRLRIGVLTDSLGGVVADEATAATVAETVARLEKMGHEVSPAALPVGDEFIEDFINYWGFLAFFISALGKRTIDKEFDSDKLDGFSKGIRDVYRRQFTRTPRTLWRLSRVKNAYADMLRQHDVVVSPVLAHSPPKLGYLSPNVPFDELLHRLRNYVAYTPLNNVAGTPAISLPAGAAADGLPVGVQISAAHGDERTLLELAFALEQDRPWRRIQDLS
ncbi:amidase [Herbihabitans rhizosphaerae]|uniref:Amidase n=1 Tax=Herbihabitans rhizosphaerae TaxID=1872711 RepID=A0A4Q7KFU3_9PSEU|nr:amidase [Herbihabitans rhizosphaerae]RZS34092.1 amidase [Herbihabitans rhizosphaerae]